MANNEREHQFVGGAGETSSSEAIDYLSDIMRRVGELEERVRRLEKELWCEICKVPRGSFLSDRDIKRLIGEGRIEITPAPNQESYGTCKVDLHLGDHAIYFNDSGILYLRLGQPVPNDYLQEYNGGDLIIHPKSIVNARTLESVSLPDDIVALVVGKSSHAREGLSVENAPLIDAGFKGKIVLELMNGTNLPLVASPSISICALAFFHLSSSTLEPYNVRPNARYVNQDRVKV